MTKPWEENWSIEETDFGPALCLGEDEGGFAVVNRGMWKNEEQLRLASAAPDMARVLLAIEWTGTVTFEYGRGYTCCSSCGGVALGDEGLLDARDDISSGKTVAGHKPDCALDAALRKAGVR